MYRFLPALLILALAIPAQADILWFKNGRKMEGKVQKLADGRVEIVLSFGTLAFEADLIDRVEKALTLEEIVQEALASLAPEDTEQLLELAAWCRDHDDHTLANRVLETLLTLEPEHEEARQRLGYVKVGNRWLDERQAREARGEVLFRRIWMSTEARDRLLFREEVEQFRRRSQRYEEASLALEITRLELEAQDLQNQNSGPTTTDAEGIPLPWVWIPTNGHPSERPPARSTEGRRTARAPAKTPSKSPPRATSSRDHSTRVKPGRQSTGTITPPRP